MVKRRGSAQMRRGTRHRIHRGKMRPRAGGSACISQAVAMAPSYRHVYACIVSGRTDANGIDDE